MIISRNLHEAATALQISGKKHFNQEFSLGFIKKHLIDKEYYAIHKNGLIGAAYFNGDQFHIGMINKGYGIAATRYLTKNRDTKATIDNWNTYAIKAAELSGFKYLKQDDEYTYMVKTCHL